ncbi:acetolactate synthase III, thiamin-dependent, small subunit [Desulfamplus magnetovallimortis]|uniref:Acetolactate synthase small subunit n=1 Tax=Desulfamplus magnetovallimortis TaxID=1246637 RepID=A0A1W1HDW1_9BACT|nr:acetolactate synthase small subunit [Desulfamplus magnetovallimortis]SLM30578.1 acetolactate synthase III, thiamin-dependent, small subunit [Desulfamplus magnetovallimortis]
MNNEKHILSILVDNEPGVLSRIAGLFSGRGYNIESLSVAQTAENSAVSRITMVTSGDEHIMEQIKKQLHKLINVITVNDLTDKKYVQRELILIKVNAKPDLRAEILRIVDIFRCRVVDVGPEHYTIEMSGDEGKLEAFVDLLRPMGIIETSRTGSIALARERKKLK